MYQALYRKWRPQTFDHMVGQEHITRTILRQVEQGRLSHAYLFTGTRGTGKTTCAKVLSKAVNCENLQEGNPCNVCPACVGIDQGAIMDVVELDAASNNGVDQVRSLREEAVYTPGSVKKRVYIIDEVHMLTDQAENALLKILEEPPEHLLFILATTEQHKVLATIRSRCQQFTFKRIVPQAITSRLSYVAEQESIPLTPEGATLLARLAEGGLRDALSLLDQCRHCDLVDEAHIVEILGLAGNMDTSKLMLALGRQETESALVQLGALYEKGRDIGSILGELSALTRDLLLLKTAPNHGTALLTGGYDQQTLGELLQLFPTARLLYGLSLLQETLVKKNNLRRTDGELCLLLLSDPKLEDSTLALSARIAALEAGAILQTPSTAQQAPTMVQQKNEIPPVVQQAPTMAQPKNEIPPVVQQAPSMTQQAPTMAQQAPSMAQQAPSMVQQAPTMAQQAPTMAQQAPPMAQQAPSMVQQKNEIPPVTQQAPVVESCTNCDDYYCNDVPPPVYDEDSMPDGMFACFEADCRYEEPQQAPSMAQQAPSMGQQGNQAPSMGQQAPSMVQQAPSMVQQVPPMGQQAPPMGQQAPPFPQVGQAPPFPQVGQAPPFPQVGQAPPFPQVGQAPPFPQVGQAPPFPQVGQAPPVAQQAPPATQQAPTMAQTPPEPRPISQETQSQAGDFWLNFCHKLKGRVPPFAWPYIIEQPPKVVGRYSQEGLVLWTSTDFVKKRMESPGVMESIEVVAKEFFGDSIRVSLRSGIAPPPMEVAIPQVAQPMTEVAQPMTQVAQPMAQEAQVAQPMAQEAQVAQPMKEVAQPMAEVAQPVAEVAQPMTEVAQPMAQEVEIPQPMTEVAQPMVQEAQPMAQEVEITQAVTEQAESVADPMDDLLELENLFNES